MDNSIEEPVATLIQPSEYSHHLNEVSGVTTKNIVFLKRKFVSRQGSEIVKYPLSDCSRIEYHDERPMYIIASGVFLVSLIIAIFYLLYLYSSEIEPGTRIKIGLFGLALMYGFRWIFGARRHRLIFFMRDSGRLSWKSSSGDFESKKLGVQRVVDLAKDIGLLHENS